MTLVPAAVNQRCGPPDLARRADWQATKELITATQAAVMVAAIMRAIVAASIHQAAPDRCNHNIENCVRRSTRSDCRLQMKFIPSPAIGVFVDAMV
jgi:hypothetical protein